MKTTRRVRPLLLGLLWIWGLLMFVVVDLFRNVPEFDRVRPTWRTYEGMRYAAHEMVDEWLDDGAHVPPSSPRLALGAALDAVDAADFDALVAIATGDGDPRLRGKALRLDSTESFKEMQGSVRASWATPARSTEAETLPSTSSLGPSLSLSLWR